MYMWNSGLFLLRTCCRQMNNPWIDCVHMTGDVIRCSTHTYTESENLLDTNVKVRCVSRSLLSKRDLLKNPTSKNLIVEVVNR